VGLLDGSLIIKSKQLDAFEEEQDDDQKMMLNAFQSSFKSKAKNYKYFFRGQYSLMPDTEDIVSSMQAKKQKLQKFETALKSF